MARAEENRRELATLPAGTRVAAVVSCYHSEVTGAMFRSAARTLVEAGLDADDLFEVRVPGAYELPLVARRLAARDDIHGVLCFGLVLKGETDHDRYISTAVAGGLMQAALETDTPVLFGVLTCNTLQQAEERARAREHGGKDKGHEVAAALIDVLAALRRAGEGFLRVPAGPTARGQAS